MGRERDKEIRRRRRRRKKLKKLKTKLANAKDAMQRDDAIEKIRKIMPWEEIPEGKGK